MRDQNRPPNGLDLTDIDALRPDEDDGRNLVNVDIEQLLDVHDAARMLNVTPSWVYEHTRPDCQDALPAIKLGKYVRFDRRDLLEYIERKRETARGRRRSR
jgi:predicted DNA-binding transcriptional regulator AlpA